jgi:hypothetical protein
MIWNGRHVLLNWVENPEGSVLRDSIDVNRQSEHVAPVGIGANPVEWNHERGVTALLRLHSRWSSDLESGSHFRHYSQIIGYRCRHLVRNIKSGLLYLYDRGQGDAKRCWQLRSPHPVNGTAEQVEKTLTDSGRIAKNRGGDVHLDSDFDAAG